MNAEIHRERHSSEIYILTIFFFYKKKETGINTSRRNEAVWNHASYISKDVEQKERVNSRFTRCVVSGLCKVDFRF